MNRFLEKHGYFLERKGQTVLVHHKKLNYGCIHVLFVFLLIPCVALTFLHLGFSLFLVPLLFFYFMEVDKRNKHADYTIINYGKKCFEITDKKGKVIETFEFKKATSVVSTDEHIGGFASADKETTEEYRREINIFFDAGQILTLFSFVSDHDDEEIEVQELVTWLEKILEDYLFSSTSLRPTSLS
ncbi:hypothetical protein [Reichenbachiella versicolor]|uniref:hypothetical protein n=1 Tax=Reichenbachiella versicolor TaxID=1821036 RepID=UPI0013A540AE|nr:hypothetical protein [Reichenbachiella versicolor]